MSSLAWKPWHQVVELRDDLRSGELSLAVFAADLYDVAMNTPQGRSVYRDPREFFALTYPTYNLRELAKDVATRLAGKNDKAIRQLELTYGGGKTHTLIALYHLAQNPQSLPDLPSVQEFTQHIGIPLPTARIGVLAFDKLDVEKGMEVLAPDGERRWLKHPWSVLAYQMAGAEGLRLLSASNTDEERDSAPAENLLVELLALPARENLSTLILIDEVLMYAREKVGMDAEWLSRIVNFFQYLTQAATKLDRCAIVASLLATDPAKSDTLGKEIVNEISAIFRRGSEEGVQPVGKEDVAEVLRRRFFKPESIRNREAFRQHVVAALKGIAQLDEQTGKDGASAEDRYLKSYPFHPDLTEVFYTKWTNLEAFQRTRGILRTFASALRDAEKWDTAPLIAANVFLGEADKAGLSEAAKQLTNVATTEEYEGKKQEWMSILEGELAKAREIEREITGIKHREVEQAVFATFLHSQPIGHEAKLRDLLLLLGATRPDRIELEKALRMWADVSWFLDEALLTDIESDAAGQKLLPKAWRLGSKPNLKQMHDDASLRVPADLIDHKLLDEIGRLKSLTAGASSSGAKVHMLPNKPSDVEDDGEFHYAVLGPRAVSDSGKPSAEARRFIEETTSAQRPRVNKNAIVLAVPSREGVDVARNRIRDYLAWEEVRSQLGDQDLDPIRAASLSANVDASRKRIPEAIQQAYNIVVTVSEKGDVQAFKITVSSEPLFNTIKADSRSRIQETAVSAEALLPEGPYNLWREGETSRRVKDLVGAFAELPHLPKMPRRKEIFDTLLLGARDGFFVLRVMRPDRSFKTFWHQEPDNDSLKDPSLEVVLPEDAVLSDIASTLLVPNALPGLWDGQSITPKTTYDYFSGGRVVKVQKEGYEEPLAIPRAARETVDSAINEAVRGGRLWLISEPSSIFAEEIPTGLLREDAQLLAPPPPLTATGVLPGSIPEAWGGSETAIQAISAALSAQAGKPLPWSTVRAAIDGALRARLIEYVDYSSALPSDYAAAQGIGLRVPAIQPPYMPPGPEPPARAGVRIAEADLRPDQIQDLADQLADIAKAAVGLTLKFRVRIELGDGTANPSADAVEAINKVLREVSDELEIK